MKQSNWARRRHSAQSLYSAHADSVELIAVQKNYTQVQADAAASVRSSYFHAYSRRTKIALYNVCPQRTSHCHLSSCILCFMNLARLLPILTSETQSSSNTRWFDVEVQKLCLRLCGVHFRTALIISFEGRNFAAMKLNMFLICCLPRGAPPLV